MNARTLSATCMVLFCLVPAGASERLHAQTCCTYHIAVGNNTPVECWPMIVTTSWSTGTVVTTVNAGGMIEYTHQGCPPGPPPTFNSVTVGGTTATLADGSKIVEMPCGYCFLIAVKLDGSNCIFIHVTKIDCA